MGWIFYQSRESKQLSNVGDLLRDRWIRWQHRHHVAIGLLVGMGGPFLVGCAIGHPLGGLLWGCLIRVVIVHHATFFINSLAHMYGRQPYSKADTSRDSWWLALLTNGEGYHNFHHRFPSDYRNGISWYQWDPTKWFIRSLNILGFTHKLHRIPPHLILRVRLEVEAQHAEQQLQLIPQEIGLSWRSRLETARAGFERALSQWAETRTQYWELNKAEWNDSDLLAQWKLKLSEYENGLHEAKSQWRLCLQTLQRTSASLRQ